jgi:hypothetical protein
MVDQYVLWVDGVGGYRICLGPRVRIGQAGSAVEIPVLADIGRQHATLVRDEEGYVLQSARRTSLNGQAVTEAVLRDGDRVTLGRTCQIQFSLPVAMSATARLDLVSGHRFPDGVDAVFLLADSLVLGVEPQVHVAIADLDEPVHLYRCQGRLAIHVGGEFTIADQPCRERAMLEAGAVVRGRGFSLALEALTAKGVP